MLFRFMYFTWFLIKKKHEFFAYKYFWVYLASICTPNPHLFTFLSQPHPLPHHTPTHPLLYLDRGYATSSNSTVNVFDINVANIRLNDKTFVEEIKRKQQLGPSAYRRPLSLTGDQLFCIDFDWPRDFVFPLNSCTTVNKYGIH